MEAICLGWEWRESEVAKLAKEKGFPQDECGVNIGYYVWDGLRKTHSLVNSFAWYNDEYNHDNLVLAPIQSLLQRWLREEKKMYVCPSIISDYEDDFHPDIVYWSFIIVNTESGDSIYREYERIDDKRFATYELALEDALKYALENLV